MGQPYLDASVYPLLAAYLAKVPGGLNAHPLILTRADYCLELRKKMSDILAAPTLPEAIRTQLTANWEVGAWIPCRVYVMMATLCRDRLWRNAQQYQEGMFEVATTMYKSAAFRALMRVLSPTLVVMGAAKRWKSFHQGTALNVLESSKRESILEVTFPQLLFNESCLLSLGATFCAAVAGTGAVVYEATLIKEEATSARWRLKWEVA